MVIGFKAKKSRAKAFWGAWLLVLTILGAPRFLLAAKPPATYEFCRAQLTRIYSKNISQIRTSSHEQLEALRTRYNKFKEWKASYRNDLRKTHLKRLVLAPASAEDIVALNDPMDPLFLAKNSNQRGFFHSIFAPITNVIQFFPRRLIGVIRGEQGHWKGLFWGDPTWHMDPFAWIIKNGIQKPIMKVTQKTQDRHSLGVRKLSVPGLILAISMGLYHFDPIYNGLNYSEQSVMELTLENSKIYGPLIQYDVRYESILRRMSAIETFDVNDPELTQILVDEMTSANLLAQVYRDYYEELGSSNPMPLETVQDILGRIQNPIYERVGGWITNNMALLRPSEMKPEAVANAKHALALAKELIQTEDLYQSVLKGIDEYFIDQEGFMAFYSDPRNESFKVAYDEWVGLPLTEEAYKRFLDSGGKSGVPKQTSESEGVHNSNELQAMNKAALQYKAKFGVRAVQSLMICNAAIPSGAKGLHCQTEAFDSKFIDQQIWNFVDSLKTPFIVINSVPQK